MALNPVAAEGKAKPGVDFAARRILRFGVALLGARITVEQIGGLGWYNGALIAAGVVVTIVVGWALARTLGLSRRIGILTGGATAICGASAAIAIAAVLPRSETSERELVFTIAGVTALSTIAMILYPVIVGWAGLDPHQAGIFLGATIHDVAQVVGAGYSISPEVGDYAVLTKMLRVAFLLPVVMVISLVVRHRFSGDGRRSRQRSAAAALSARLHRLRRRRQPRLDSQARRRRAERALARLPRGRDRRGRPQDLARRNEEGRRTRDRSPGSRNRLPRGRRARCAEARLKNARPSR